MHFFFSVFSGITFLLVASCSQNKFDVQLKEHVKINVIRLDSVLFGTSPDVIMRNITDYYVQYPTIFDAYMRRIVRLGGVESRNFYDYLHLFLRNPEIRESYDSVRAVFGDFRQQKEEIEKAFSYVRHHIPGFPVPEIYTVVSGFNESILMTDSALALSLDKFLGQRSIFYERVSLPRYMRKRTDPKLLPVEVVRNWVYSEFENRDSIKNLSSEMIYHGKIMYLMDAAFPKYADNMKISFAPSDIIWAKKSEKHMWAFIIDKKLLFNTDPREIRKYVDDAPFVSTFGEDSPGRIGAWIGWQIVRSYMKRNPSVSVEQLMRMHDHHQILIESGYSPG
jgi:hypothetical protein